ncbi:MAG: TIGR03618 family F420-dependent PPOX class oxidoreductase [Actinomycetota bacterium]|nr:TIGR03618 family F420-dependent PPOX class oxidoreductase [Actinomycetota bacterium]
MADLDGFALLIETEHNLVVVATSRDDGTVQASVVNAGVMEHPLTGQRVVGLVALGGAHKLANLRARPRATIVGRSGWRWVGVEGPAQLIGPDDPAPGIDAEGLRLLLRAIFTAAGGTHDDWDTYDRVMAEERRTAVLVTPERVYGAG